MSVPNEILDRWQPLLRTAEAFWQDRRVVATLVLPLGWIPTQRFWADWRLATDASPAWRTMQIDCVPDPLSSRRRRQLRRVVQTIRWDRVCVTPVLGRWNAERLRIGLTWPSDRLPSWASPIHLDAAG